MGVASAALTLFLVFAPLGSIPVFLALLQRVEARRRRWVIIREHLVALGVLLIALLGGPALMQLLGVEQPSLQIGGGVVIFLIALRMIFPSAEGVFGDSGIEGEPLVVPLAVPLLAGPSSLATVMLFATQEPDHLAKWLAAVVIAWSASLGIVLVAQSLQRVLGQRGLAACERLMGMVLVVVAVQMTGNGLRSFMAGA